MRRSFHRCNKKIVPTGSNVRILDIGVGANCVYPLIGHAEYGWDFLGVDIDEAALANAALILSKNSGLTAAIELRHQAVWDNIFIGLLRSGETFDLSLCNPPFHNSPDEVLAVSQRKWNNLGKPGAVKGSSQPRLNFGGSGTRTVVQRRRTRLRQKDDRTKRQHPETGDVVHQSGLQS